MSTTSRRFFLALTGAVLLSSCSRPVAYFQRTPTEQFHSLQTVVTADPAKTTTAIVPDPEVIAQAPVEQVAQAKQAMSRLEAYVRNDNKLASNKKLTKRLARVNELLATSKAKTALPTNATSAKKMTPLERIIFKKIDKKIENHIAPDKTNELNQNIITWSIVAAIGIIFMVFFSGAISIIGGIAFLLGIVMVLLDVSKQR